MNWLVRDMAVPGLITLLCGLVATALLPHPSDIMGKLLVIGATCCVVILSTACTLSDVRSLLRMKFLLNKQPKPVRS